MTIMKEVGVVGRYKKTTRWHVFVLGEMNVSILESFRWFLSSPSTKIYRTKKKGRTSVHRSSRANCIQLSEGISPTCTLKNNCNLPYKTPKNVHTLFSGPAKLALFPSWNLVDRPQIYLFFNNLMHSLMSFMSQNLGRETIQKTLSTWELIYLKTSNVVDGGWGPGFPTHLYVPPSPKICSNYVDLGSRRLWIEWWGLLLSLQELILMKGGPTWTLVPNPSCSFLSQGRLWASSVLMPLFIIWLMPVLPASTSLTQPSLNNIAWHCAWTTLEIMQVTRLRHQARRKTQRALI